MNTTIKEDKLENYTTKEEGVKKIEEPLKKDAPWTDVEAVYVHGKNKNLTALSAAEKLKYATTEKYKRQSAASEKNHRRHVDSYKTYNPARNEAGHIKTPVLYAIEKNEIVVVGEANEVEAWVPKSDNVPYVVTHLKRLILQSFCDNFRQSPEHYFIDNYEEANLEPIMSTTDSAAVGLFIEKINWTSFTARVPRERRGFHIFSDGRSISIEQNLGYHTLKMQLRCTVEASLESLTKKEMKKEAAFVGASCYTRFLEKHAASLKLAQRQPGEVSVPLVMGDPVITLARELECGEEVTDTGVILTPLRSSPKPLIPNMNWFSDPLGVKESSKELSTAVKEAITEGLKVEMPMGELNALADRISNTLDEKLKNINVNHSLKFDFGLGDAYSKLTDDYLGFLKPYLPSDPRVRDILIIIFIGLVYHWAIKKGEEYANSVFIGLGVATGLSHWCNNPVVTAFCGTLFGLEVCKSMPSVYEYIKSMFTTKSVPLVENSAINDFSSAFFSGFVPTVFLATMARYIGQVFLGFVPPMPCLADVPFMNMVANGLVLTYTNILDSMIKWVNLLTSGLGFKMFKTVYTEFPELFDIIDYFNELNRKFQGGHRVTKIDYADFLKKIDIVEMTSKKISLGAPFPAVNKRDDIYRQQIAYCRSMINALYVKFRAVGVILGGDKPAPYMVTLYSPPGYGKSVLTKLVTKSMAPIVLTRTEYEEYKIDPKSYEVTINPSDEFQEEARTRHKIYIIDDIFQMKNEGFDPKICHGNWLIGFNNNIQRVINHAFGNKGEDFYNGLFGVASTNTSPELFKGNTTKLSVTDKDAVARRMGDCWKVDVTDPFRSYSYDATGKPVSYQLDDAKAAADGSGDCWSFDSTSYMSTISNSVEAKPAVTGTYSYNNFLFVTAKRYVDHHIKQEILLETFRNLDSNKRMNPFAGMNKLEILSYVARVDFGDRVPLSQGSDVSLMMNKNADFSLELAEELRDRHYRPWIRFFGMRSEKVIRGMMASLDESMWLGLTSLIPTWTDLSDEQLLKEVKVARIRYENMKPHEIEKLLQPMVVENERVSPIVSTLKEWFPDDQEIVNMYRSDPAFFLEFVENSDMYAKWISESSKKFGFDAVIKILGHRIICPSEHLSLFLHFLKQTFAICSAVGRRVCWASVDVMRAMAKSATWFDFITDSWSIFKTHVWKLSEDVSTFKDDVLNMLALGLPLPGTWLAAFSAAAVFALSAGPIFEKNLEENSLLKIRVHPKEVKKTTTSKVKTIDLKPALHLNPGEAALKATGNSLYFDSGVKDLENAVIENTYTMVQDGNAISNGVFIQDRVLMANAHTIAAMFPDTAKPGDTFSLVDPRGVEYEVLKSHCKPIISSEIDLGIINVNQSKIGARPTIIKKHITNALLDEVKGIRDLQCLLTYHVVEDGIRKIRHIPVTVDTRNLETQTSNGIKVARMFAYSVAGHAGACFSSLILCDDRFKGKHCIMGYHSSGSQSGEAALGASVAVTQELLEKLLEHADSYIFHPVEPVQILREDANIPPRVPILAKVEPVSMSNICKLKKTPLYGFYDDIEKYEKQPSILVPYEVQDEDGNWSDMRFPMYQALARFNKDVPAINDHLANYARVMYTSTHDASLGSFKPEPSVWRFEDAVNGKNCVGPDSRSSSVGYELRIRNITKKMMYGPEGDRDLTNPTISLLQSELKDDIGKLREGIYPNWSFLGFLKSEMRSLRKLLGGDMRYIAGTEWKCHMVTKMYFGHMISESTRCSIKNGNLMGFNPYSRHCDTLASFLTIFPFRVDGDFQEFDTTIRSWLAEQYKLFTRHVYYNGTEEEHRIRDILIDNMIISQHIISIRTDEGIIAYKVQVINDIPSGGTLTQHFGCFANQILARYSYLMSWCIHQGFSHKDYSPVLHPKPDLISEEDNQHHITLGDDNIYCFREPRYGHTPIRIQKNFSEIGMTYTSPDKSTPLSENWRTMDEVEILQRHLVFCKDLGRWTCPIAVKSILGALYYTEDLKSLPATIDTMLQEMSLRGEEEFGGFVSRLRARADEVNMLLVSPYLDFHVARNFVLNTTYAPWGGVTTAVIIEDI